jgi:hypothetical protein
VLKGPAEIIAALPAADDDIVFIALTAYTRFPAIEK